MTASTTVSKSADGSGVMLETRKRFLLQLALGAIQPQAITHWEEITCVGYTVSLSATTRVILDSSPGYFPRYGPKAVGFAKQPYPTERGVGSPLNPYINRTSQHDGISQELQWPL
jgi:hypothetical protein